MHPAAFYFSGTYTNGISLSIIIKDFHITQALIILIKLLQFAALIGFVFANPKPQFKAVSFSDIFWLLYCTQNNRELTLVYRPILSKYMLYSNQLLFYQFNTLWDDHILMSKQHFLIQIYNRFLFLGLCKNRKDTKHLNNFSRCIKRIKNII